MTDHPEIRQSFTRRIPADDSHERLVCDSCGWIHYENPKIVVGAVSTWGDRILLCRRAIEPREGYWTIPAGFLEEHETTEQGAIRETREEAGAEVDLTALLAVYSIPRISQVQLIYRGRLKSADFEPGVESHEARLFAWSAIPWPDLAFPSVHWALGHFRAVEDREVFAPFTNPPGESGNRMPGRT